MILRTFLGVVLAVGSTACVRTVPSPPPAAKLEIVELRSRVFGNTRTLRVWLPPGYAESSDSLPVVYLNDGQNLFDADTSQSSAGEWMADETAARLVRNGRIPPLILVGIDNPGLRERPREYLPWADVFLAPPEPNPRGRDYPRFLLEEVVPAIEARYRTNGRRYLGGSSYGALIALYTGSTHPSRFDGLLLESPSLYVNDGAALALAAEAPALPDRVYLGIGSHEGATECRADNRVEDAVADVRRLQRILANANVERRVRMVVEECGMHSERFWAGRLPGALEFLLEP